MVSAIGITLNSLLNAIITILKTKEVQQLLLKQVQKRLQEANKILTKISPKTNNVSNVALYDSSVANKILTKIAPRTNNANLNGLNKVVSTHTR